MSKKDRLFVKSGDTSTPVSRSQAEIRDVLTRYGAVGFSVAEQMNDQRQTVKVVIEFVVPDSIEKGAAKVPVRLPVDILGIYDALYGRPTEPHYWTPAEKEARKSEGLPVTWGEYRWNPKGYEAKKLAQAERVAWRNLKLWIDAALSAAVAKLQTITEAFLAHTLVVDDHGGTTRMMDYLERTQGALAPGVRALLAAPAQEES